MYLVGAKERGIRVLGKALVAVPLSVEVESPDIGPLYGEAAH